MKRNYAGILCLLITVLFIFPPVAQARVNTDELGLSFGLVHVNNSGYGDVYGSLNWSIGATYDIFFASRRRLGLEFGFRLNYDSGETTGTGNSASFRHFPIFAGMKYRYITEKKWYPYFGAGIQQLFYSESVDSEDFDDTSGNSIGFYFNGGFQRKWGRTRSTFYEIRFSSNSVSADDGSGTGGKSPDTGSLEFIFGVAFGIR
jgi:hypothetical protein